MNSMTVERLAGINREFYDRMGASFSATRQRLQPGVRKILEGLQGDENILDLGCGNGLLARMLARSGHRGVYLGIDSSPHMIREAQEQNRDTRVKFIQADLMHLAAADPVNSNMFADAPLQDNWSLILAFAVLHHIPGDENRLQILKFIRQKIARGGRFMQSNWQFLHDAKMRARSQSWDQVGVKETEVEEGDTLLDWRGGGYGLRYVHQYSEVELKRLAEQTGFRILEVFYSDGRGGKMSMYQIWEPTEKA